MDIARIESFRETIGGVEVVDAAFADGLLNATIKMMRRHNEWRTAQREYRADMFETEDGAINKTLLNRYRAARSKYRKARWECWQVVNEATGDIHPIDPPM